MGAGHPPVADRDLLGLPKALELGLRPVDLQRRDQARRESRGEVHQQFGPGDRCPDAQQPSASRLQGEKALRDLEQHVVPGSLEISPSRVDHPTRRQRRKNGVGEPHGQGRAAADEERLPTLAEVLAGEDVLLDPVMPEVIDAGIEVRDPECLGLEVKGQRLLDLGGRGGDVQRPGPGQRHRGREVDRQAARGGCIHPAARQSPCSRARVSAAGRAAVAGVLLLCSRPEATFDHRARAGAMAAARRRPGWPA